MSDLHQLTAAAQLRALRTREVSSRDLTQHYLDRIQRLDSQLGAFVTVVPEDALAEAARADDRLAAGDAGDAPLLGLPLGIKDLHTTTGLRTTFGSAALADFVPLTDAWTVGLLRSAGAIVVGKTNTAEFGATCYTDNDVTAMSAVTPYDVTRYASGSSGGAATAVAAGLLPVGHGSDGAGSIRTPAATCHLVGVKPSRGLVTSSVPATSMTATSIEGPIARTVEDAALLLDVMARPWAGDLYGWRPDASFVDALSDPPTQALRVAMWTDTGLDDLRADVQSIRAAERTARLLGELGHEVHEMHVPATCDEPVRQALKTWFAAAVNSVVSSVVPPERRRSVLPYTRHLDDAGSRLRGSDILEAHAVLARYASTFLAAFEGFDIALTPVTSAPPVPVGHFLEGGLDSVADRMLEWSCYTPWANFTGQPAVCLPSHLDRDGLPYAVQLVGRPQSDAHLLAVAAQLEQAQLWDDVHPPCWDQ